MPRHVHFLTAPLDAPGMREPAARTAEGFVRDSFSDAGFVVQLTPHSLALHGLRGGSHLSHALTHTL